MSMADPDFTGKRAVTKLTILLAARLGVEIDQGDVEGLIRKDWEKISCLAHSAHNYLCPKPKSAHGDLTNQSLQQDMPQYDGQRTSYRGSR